MRHFALMLLTVVLSTVFIAFGGQKGVLSRELDVDLSGGNVVQNVDTHGGFHGDGTSFVELSFSGKAADRLAEDIPDLGGWEALPLTDNLHRAVYGSNGRGSTMCEDEIPNMPPVEDGYYCFIDRHSESADPKDDTDLFTRYSHNFTLAIYDRDNDTIYIYKSDT